MLLTMAGEKKLLILLSRRCRHAGNTIASLVMVFNAHVFIVVIF
jgi:hypothetical protein